MELERQKKVISMMITAHSVLSEKYSKLASFFEITLLIASIILNALVFVDSRIITRLTFITEEDQKIIIGLVTIIVFIISIILLKVNWKEKSATYLSASNELFQLLQECRNILEMSNLEEKDIVTQQFDKKYIQIINLLPIIPNNKFNQLKLIHYRKIELSKLIDKNPTSRLFILKIKLFLSSFKQKNNK